MIVAASFDINNPELWVNRGLAYGDGLFETMRMTNKRIPLLEFHLNRLAVGLKCIRLNAFDRKVIDMWLENIDIHTLNGVNQNAVIIKLMVFRANQARTYTPLTQGIEWLITAEPMPQILGDRPVKLGISEQIISEQPILAGTKHLSRMEQVMLAAELNENKKIDDLLLVDKKNRIIETSYQNVILVKKNQLVTPKLNKSGVKGVALKWLKTNHAVETRHIKTSELCDYDGIMVCNSVRGFRAVDSVYCRKNGHISFGTSLPIHDKINHQWDVLFKS